MKTLENLERGEVILSSMRQVSGGKIELTFGEILETRSNPSAVGMFNEGDDRFQKSKPTLCWMTATPQGLKKHLPQITDDLLAETEKKEGRGRGAKPVVVDLNILNPALPTGERLRIRMIETTQGDTYDFANLEKKAKRAGENGPFIKTPQGEYIFRKPQMVYLPVGQEPEHVLLEGKQDVRVAVAATPGQEEL